jgi:cytochrome P450 family 130
MTGANFEPRSGLTWRDPFSMYAALRAESPVHHVEDGDYWVLSRFGHVFDAVRDAETFSSAQGLTFTYGDMELLAAGDVKPMVMLDPPEHTDFRRAVGKGFSPSHVAPLEGAIRAFVVGRLERVQAIGACDIVSELFKPLPSMVVAHFLGVPEVDRGRFDRWTDAIVAATAAGNTLSAGDAVGEIFEYFTDLVERRRTDPGDDTLSHLVTGTDDKPGRTLLDVLGFAFTMITGGNDTTTGLLGGSAELLTAWPQQRSILQEDPAKIGPAIDELLRLTTPVQGLARTATRDVDYGDAVIPAGAKVMLLYGSANRDESEFGDTAGSLDVERRPRRIVSFGYGPHHCLGAVVARLQGRIALEELLARFPDFSVDAEQGEFAPGHFVRRYESLPFDPVGMAH